MDEEPSRGDEDPARSRAVERWRSRAHRGRARGSAPVPRQAGGDRRAVGRRRRTPSLAGDGQRAGHQASQAVGTRDPGRSWRRRLLGWWPAAHRADPPVPPRPALASRLAHRDAREGYGPNGSAARTVGTGGCARAGRYDREDNVGMVFTDASHYAAGGTRATGAAPNNHIACGRDEAPALPGHLAGVERLVQPTVSQRPVSSFVRYLDPAWPPTGEGRAANRGPGPCGQPKTVDAATRGP